MYKNIIIFNRQNTLSKFRKKDLRPSWFSYEKCFKSILKNEKNYSIFLDNSDKDTKPEYLNGYNVININEGSDAGSFNFMLDYFQKNQYNEDDIIYFVEDDYMHVDHWEQVLIEGIEMFPDSYISLYDHPDKYFKPAYPNLLSTIHRGPYFHWRSTPSTTNTYACKVKTLRADFKTHKHFSNPETTFDGYDHQKFLALNNLGRTLYTCLPGASTHCEYPFISPYIDWSRI